MEDERIARALNLLGENSDLFFADGEGLLDLIGDYFDNRGTESKLLAQPTVPPAIISVSVVHEHS